MVLLNTQCVLTTLRNEILRQLKSSSKFLDPHQSGKIIMLCQGRTLIKECLIDSVQQNLLSTESMEFKNGLL